MFLSVNMAEVFKLASSRIPNFKGMKADLGVAVQVADYLQEDQRIFIANHVSTQNSYFVFVRIR